MVERQSFKRIFTLLICILGLFWLDYWSKSLILHMHQAGQLPIQVNEFFNISLAWNRGISFSFFADTHEQMPYILAGFSCLISSALFIWMWRETVLTLQTGFAFVIAGGLANAYDRLAYGAVVDFIQVHYQEHFFPTFNVADICINIGVGLVLLEMFILSKYRG